VEPFGHMILPWRLCLHSSTPAWYVTSGISIAKRSPLTTGWGRCDSGISHRLVKAWAKVLGGLGWLMI
jgi:hypothetical protein